MLSSLSLEEGLIVFIIIHILLGISQFIYYPAIQRYIDGQRFPDKSFFVSVIVPVRGETATLEKNFRSMCTQEYPHYEVIFVSEEPDDPGIKIAERLIQEYKKDSKAFGDLTRPSKIRYVCSGLLESPYMIAKSHNMLKAIEIAEGEVYLFTDSDVFHPNNWIRELVNPLGEEVRGRRVSASTAVFFIDPEGFLGIFPSLSTNAAAYLSSFTRKYQDLPTYASGASMAVFSAAFHDAQVADAWRTSFNDDLVMGSTLVDHGYNIFNVRRLPTRPTEKFDSWEGMNRKMVRWMLTVNHYTHPKFHKEALTQGIFNLQFQILVNISIFMALLDAVSMISLDWSVVVWLLAVCYFYNVFTRLIIARIIHEKNVYPYLLISPISQYFWGLYFIVAMIFIKRFTWGGRVYTLSKRFGKLATHQ